LKILSDISKPISLQKCIEKLQNVDISKSMAFPANCLYSEVEIKLVGLVEENQKLKNDRSNQIFFCIELINLS
jgi:hypothetical protein